MAESIRDNTVGTSRNENDKFTFHWTIKDYNFFPSDTNELIKSPPFQTNESKNTYIELDLAWITSCAEYETFLMSVHNYKGMIEFNVESISAAGKDIFVGEKEDDRTWEFKKLKSKSESKSSDVFLKKTLIITALIPKSEIPIVRDESFVVEDKALKEFAQDIEKLFNDKKLCDLSIFCQSVGFDVHKAVIWARFPKFAQAYQINEIDSLIISDISAEAFQAALSFAYTAKLGSICEFVADELLRFANKYGIKDLGPKVCFSPDDIHVFSRVKTDYKILHLVVNDWDQERYVFPFSTPVFGSGSVSNYSLRLIGRASFHSYGLDYYELTVRRLSTNRDIPFLIKIKLTIENVKLKLQKSYNSEVLLHKHKKKINLTVASERKHRLGENEYGVDDTQPGDIELTVELYVSGINVSHTVDKKTSTILTNYLSVQNTDVPLYKDLRTLSKDFQSLFAIKTPMLHDVAIKIGDLIISADKAILAARSSELANKIQGSKLSCDGVTFIEISDFEPKLVNMMLEYIYSSQLPSMDNPTAMDMYKVAVEFKMETMKNECVRILQSNVTIENALTHFEFAHAQQDKNLKLFFKKYILDKIDQYLEMPCWQRFQENNSELAAEIFN